MAGGPFAMVPAALPPHVFAAVRAALFTLALVPFAELMRLGFTGGLGANPVEFVLRWLGTWTLVTLLATLAITPLRWVTGWAWLIRLRRMLGLYAFFYGTLHVASYVWIDHFFNWADIVDDIARRPYLTFGFMAFVLMIPLAITSAKYPGVRPSTARRTRCMRVSVTLADFADFRGLHRPVAREGIDVDTVSHTGIQAGRHPV